MVCINWNSKDGFCSKKEMTINYEDLSFCAQNCRYYTPFDKVKMAVCNNCEAIFKLKNGKFMVKNKEYFRCPECGSTNVKRDDEALSKGANSQNYRR